MPYPRNLINDGENVALDLRPHWWYFSKHILTGIPLLILVVIVFQIDDDTLKSVAGAIVGIITIGWGIWLLLKFISWTRTYFVVTDQRVVYRTGVIARHGVEIPLERINNLNFHQRLFERMIGAGDLEVQSAGEQGTTLFENVRHPDGVQQEIYRQMEGDATRDAGRGAQEIGKAVADAVKAQGGGGRWPDHPRADRGAREAARPGAHHAGRVRQEEERAAREDVGRSGAGRLPRSVRYGEPPHARRAARSGAPGSATRRGSPSWAAPRTPMSAAIVGLGPDLVVVNDEENRREDADALVAAGLTLHPMSPRSVVDVAPAVRALADAVGAIAPPERDPPVGPDLHRSIVVFVWRRPWMTLAADTYAASLLATLGYDQIPLGALDRYPETTLARGRRGIAVARAAPRRAVRVHRTSPRRGRRARCPAPTCGSSTVVTCSGGEPGRRTRSSVCGGFSPEVSQATKDAPSVARAVKASASSPVAAP